MAEFFRLNGIAIEVEDGSMRFGLEEQGSRARAADASLRSTRTTAPKRTWRCRTPKDTNPETALMIMGLLSGSGHRFSFDVDAFDLKGFGPLDPSAANVYSLRPGVIPSKPQAAEYGLLYGGAIAVEDGTTSLFPSNVQLATNDLNNTTGFTAVDAPGTFQSTDLPGLGVGREALTSPLGLDRVLEFETSAVANAVRGGIKTDAVVVAAATTYTASVFIQASGPVRCQLNDVVNGVAGSIQTFTPPEIGAATWRRMSSTVTTGGGVPQVEFLVLEANADSVTQVYCSEFQLEAKPGPTSWIESGTRAAGLLKMDAQSYVSTGRVVAEDIRTAVDLTAMLWINRADDRFEGQRALFYLAENPLLSTNDPRQGHYLGLETLTVGAAISYEVYAGGNSTPTPAALPINHASTLALNTWKHVAIVVRRSGKYGADANTLKLYLDGVLVAESQMIGANESLPDFSKMKALYLGTRGGSTGAPVRFTGGLMDDFVVVPYAMSAAGIAAIGGGGGRVFTDLPRLEAEGDAIVASPFKVLVLGELPTGEFVQAHLSAVWVQNLRVVEIMIQEV